MSSVIATIVTITINKTILDVARTWPQLRTLVEHPGHL